MRLDQALAAALPDYSRSRIQQWIRSGRVRVDGRARDAKDRVQGGEWVELEVEAEILTSDVPEAIPLTLVYRDASILVIDKPAGLVVHPAIGHRAGTLLNALLHHAPEVAQLPRAGIVHRLDKDTTGLLVVACREAAQNSLQEQLQTRTVSREYLAVVQGRMTAGGTIDAPLGRHPTDRLRFAVRQGGKPSISHYRVVERYAQHTLVRVYLETGRTHQIRVHMAYAGHPLVGDPLYGGRARSPAGVTALLAERLRTFPRQALHAARLALIHPAQGVPMSWESSLPKDFQMLIEALRAES